MNFIKYANKYNIPLIGSNNVKFENEEDYNAHDALLCIAQKSTINQTNRILTLILTDYILKTQIK